MPELETQTTISPEPDFEAEPAMPEGATSDSMLEMIAGAGEMEPDESESTKAPDDGNPDPDASKDDEGKAPEDGQPDGDKKTPGENGEGEGEAKTPEEVEAEKQRQIREKLNLSETEPDTPERLREKYQQSSQEAHALRDAEIARANSLAEAGYELVHTGEGKWALKLTDDFADKFSDDFVPSVSNELTPDELELASTDPQKFAELVEKKAHLDMLGKRPVATAKSSDITITQNQSDAVFARMLAAQTRQGEKVYPDMGDTDVKDFMVEVFNDPKNATLRNVMSRSEESWEMGMDFIYNKVANVLAPIKAMQADAEAKKKQDEENKRKEPSSDASETGGSPKSKSGSSPADDEADRIANANL